jgi:hypothetical protein
LEDLDEVAVFGIHFSRRLREEEEEWSIHVAVHLETLRRRERGGWMPSSYGWYDLEANAVRGWYDTLGSLLLSTDDYDPVYVAFITEQFHECLNTVVLDE